MVGTEVLKEKYTAGQKLNCQKIIRNGRDGGFGRKVHGRSKVKLSKNIRNGRDGGLGREVHGRSEVKLSKNYTVW